MSAECEKCSEHVMDCSCDNYICPDPIKSYSVKIVRNKMRNRLLTFALDLIQWKHRLAIFNLEKELTVEDLSEFCKKWVEENDKSFNEPTNGCEGIENLKIGTTHSNGLIDVKRYQNS